MWGPQSYERLWAQANKQMATQLLETIGDKIFQIIVLYGHYNVYGPIFDYLDGR